MIRNKKQGFTLIELLVVVAIIGTLSGIVMASLQNARKKTYNAVRNDNAMQIANALELYRVNNNNTLPTTGGVWKCVGMNSNTATPNCWGASAFTGSTSLFANLTTYMKSGIPIDPAPGLVGGSTHYVYGSSVGPYASNPAGAYLTWVVQNLGQPTATACGRGQYIADVFDHRQCIMFVGN